MRQSAKNRCMVGCDIAVDVRDLFERTVMLFQGH